MHVAHDMTDHEFAAYLRKKGAIDNFVQYPIINVWYDNTGAEVAVVAYDNSTSTRTIILED